MWRFLSRWEFAVSNYECAKVFECSKGSFLERLNSFRDFDTHIEPNRTMSLNLLRGGR
jgi:hypothetical protein